MRLLLPIHACGHAALATAERAGAGTLFLDDFVCVLTVFCTYTKNDILKRK